jgi:hypothetical protein
MAYDHAARRRLAPPRSIGYLGRLPAEIAL